MADDTPDVDALAASLVSAKEQIEAAADALDDAKRAYAKIEAQMLEALSAADKTLVKSGARYVSTKTTHRWSLPKEGRDEVIQLLKTHKPDLVKETVHPASLNKAAEQQRTADAPAPWWAEVGDKLTYATTTAVRVTKSKPKK